MSIMRITVRTFQNEQHAEMFVAISQKIYEDAMKDNFKINFTMIQNPSLKNQVTSIWKYDNEKHIKEVRSYLSKHNSIPNSLSPKEVVFTGDVILDSNS
jgi:hypothetical protein|tara:strand:+ start:290 stop:586 length:297 start_codon:yes stop_codon:yes gene_type:complete